MAIDTVLQHNPNHVPASIHHAQPGRVIVGLPVRPHTTQQQQDEEKAAAKKKPTPKKKRVYLQRDSLANRNALLMGKEGSRRRNRWDNNHFVDHPHAVLRAEDLPSPGYPLDAPKFHWTYDATAGHLTSADLDRLQHADQRRPPPPRPNHPHIRRAVRQELKRSHVPEGTVQKFETELIKFLERCNKEEKEWIMVEGVEDEGEDEDGVNEEEAVFMTREEETKEGAMYLVWEIGDKFSRYIVHAMCQYYNLESFSRTTKEGRRLTYVYHPRHQSQLSDSEESDTDVVAAVPPKTFFDYLFL